MSYESDSLLDHLIENHYDKEEYDKENEEITMEEYLKRVKDNPDLIRSAHQRLADMIDSYGYDNIPFYNKEIKRYKIFNDPFTGEDALFGIDVQLNKFVNTMKNAARGLGADKRILLLHGPVGSAKSSLARLVKKGLEAYSKDDAGAMYTFKWVDTEASDILGGAQEFLSPMNDDPMRLLEMKTRSAFIKSLNLEENQYKYQNLDVKGSLCPADRDILNRYLKKYKGDLKKVLEKHIVVRRLILSEKDRIGIGTFQPKDEKNQDSTELTGDINYRKIAQYGSDSDPRAFNFDGEFNISNRGVIEFVEMLKLDTAFLYDLLTASQEKKIKPKKFPQTHIDLIIIGHTNEAEYKKLQDDEFMEALHDRTIKLDIPYITKLDDEVKIYQKDYQSKYGMHIAPHTLEIASYFAVLTRLENPLKAEMTLEGKLELYNGKTVSGYSSRDVIELKEQTKREGLEGISPRFIQDRIANGLIAAEDAGFITPFDILKSLPTGVKENGLIKTDEQRARCEYAIAACWKHLDFLLQKDIKDAVIFDEGAMETLCSKYLDNIKAYTQKERIQDPYSHKLVDPDESFMSSVEEKAGVQAGMRHDFRHQIMGRLGSLSISGEKFTYKSNERLHKALESVLIENQKHQLKLTSMVTNVVDKATEERINIIRSRLVEKFGYTPESATKVMEYVASIQAKGDATLTK